MYRATKLFVQIEKFIFYTFNFALKILSQTMPKNSIRKQGFGRVPHDTISFSCSYSYIFQIL
jgi:hypothetical protein